MYNSLYRTAFVVAALFLLTVGPVAAQDGEMADEQPDIVDTAVQADGFNTLVQALKAADLVEALRGDGPFTVFAPTDDAFAALPDHVVSGKAMASDVTGMDAAPTLEGRSVQFQVNDGPVTLMGQNTATVVQADIEASNGVIHVIDSVLLPPKKENTSGM
ncbi:MAG: Nex18 symbiotically induced protein [Bacteroidetes bacterium QH_2_63_10]|nr:MAG: Nex18 symbiotically induced protein [Bacteroidetes bacterium QH_2_63_10]